MGKVHKHSDPLCYTPLSEPLNIDCYNLHSPQFTIHNSPLSRCSVNYGADNAVCNKQGNKQYMLPFVFLCTDCDSGRKFRPFSSSGGLSPASHRGVPGSSQCQVMWICGGQSGTGAGFLRVLRFPLPSIPSTAQHSSSLGAGTVDRLVASVTADLVPLHPR
jgi:hypothetical protein